MSVVWNCEVKGETVKPFPKTPRNIVTLTIDENGDLIFLKTDSADIFLELGTTITKRASHVEPADRASRILFHIIRRVVSDKSMAAAWTRTWACEWRVNTAPVGGPILTWKDVYGGSRIGNARPGYNHRIATWRNRQEAIDAEIVFLNNYFAERGIQ